jgi:endonuclease III
VLPGDLYLFEAYISFGKYGKANDFLAVPLEKIQDTLKTFGLNDDNSHYVKGLFSDIVKEW